MIYKKEDIEKIKSEIKNLSDGFLNISENEIKKYICAKNKNILPDNFSLFSHCLEKAIVNGVFDVDFVDSHSHIHGRDGITYSKQSLNQKGELLNFLQKHIFDNYRIYRMVAERQGIPAGIILDKIDKTKWEQKMAGKAIPARLLCVPFLKRDKIAPAAQDEIVEQLTKHDIKLIGAALKNCSDASRVLIENHDISKMKFNDDYVPEWLIASIKSSKKWHKSYDEFLQYGTSEDILTAIINNEYLGTKRDEAFGFGINIFDVDLSIATDFTKEEIYRTCADAILDNTNLLSKSKHQKNIDLMLDLIKNRMPVSIQTDLVNRLFSSNIYNCEKEEIMRCLARYSKNEKVLDELISRAKSYFSYTYSGSSPAESAFYEELTFNKFVNGNHSYEILNTMPQPPSSFITPPELIDEFCDGYTKHLSNFPSKGAALILSRCIDRYEDNKDLFCEKLLVNQNMPKPVLSYMLKNDMLSKINPSFQVLANLNLELSEICPGIIKNSVDIYNFVKTGDTKKDFDILREFSNKIDIIDNEKLLTIKKFIKEQRDFLKGVRFNYNDKSHYKSFQIEGFLNVIENVAISASQISKDVEKSLYSTHINLYDLKSKINYTPEFSSNKFLIITKDDGCIENLASLSEKYFEFFCDTFDKFSKENIKNREWNYERIHYHKDGYRYDSLYYEKLMQTNYIIEEVKEQKLKEKEIFVAEVNNER